MAVKGSRAVIVTVNSGLTGLKVHAGRLEFVTYTEDVSGDTDTNDVIYVGARQIRLVLECSWNTSATAMLFPGATANIGLQLASGGTTYTEDFILIGDTWDWEKRGGDRPQRFNVILTPHAEASSNQTVTTGLFTP